MKKILCLCLLSIIAFTSCNNTQTKFDQAVRETKNAISFDRRSSIFEPELIISSEGNILCGVASVSEAKQILISKLDSLKVRTIDSMRILPSAELEQYHYGLASLSVINLRYEPDYSSEMATQVLMGHPLKIYEKRGSWLRVETAEGYFAWTEQRGVRIMTKSELDQWKNNDRLIVDTYFTVFRAEPKDNAKVICDAVWGDIVEIDDNSETQKWQQFGLSLISGIGRYQRIRIPDGRLAFVLKKDVTSFDSWLDSRIAVLSNEADSSAVEQARQSIINTAENFMGFPYLWAGCSVKGMDCSGFVKTVYMLNGIQLLRDCSQMCKTGVEIDISAGLSNLKMGDLIFFGASQQRKDRITHVGIYISDGLFIHSSSCIRVNSLKEGDANYYGGAQRLSKAVRIISKQHNDSGIVTLGQHQWYN